MTTANERQGHRSSGRGPAFTKPFADRESTSTPKARNPLRRCGARINALRERQIRNFLATLLLSQGTPRVLAGDEFGRTQIEIKETSGRTVPSGI